MKTKAFILIFAAALAIFGIVYYYQTEESHGEDRLLSSEKLDSLDATSISGSTNLQDIIDIYEIDEDDMRSAFLLEDSINLYNFETKDLESYYTNIDESIDLGNEAVQAFVALYKGLDYYISEIYLPESAISLLISLNKLNADQIAHFETYTVSNIETDLTALSVEEDEGVSGNTTLQDLINSGLTLEQLEEIGGTKIEDTNIYLKDYAEENGLSYGFVKDQVNILLSE
jgi:hypothetical protein